MEGTFHVSRIEWRRTKRWNRIKRSSVFFEVLHRSENQVKSGEIDRWGKRGTRLVLIAKWPAYRVLDVSRDPTGYRKHFLVDLSSRTDCRIRNTILLLVTARPIIVSHLWMQFDTVCLLPSRRFCPTFCNLISLASRTNKNSGNAIKKFAKLTKGDNEGEKVNYRTIFSGWIRVKNEEREEGRRQRRKKKSSWTECSLHARKLSRRQNWSIV